jgi:phosphatidylserine/phosphatidylglycerophosphate/cardiolipin synthase-like enzyme
MSTSAVRLAVRLSRQLPASDVRVLAEAVRGGSSALRGMQSKVAGVAVRAACQKLLKMHLSDGDRHLVAGALLGALEADPRAGALDVVWTGPASTVATSRLTSAVVVDLIDSAQTDVLLVGYAVHTEPSVAGALRRAQDRGVDITLLLERNVDNAAFSGAGSAFPGLIATRLSWPTSARDAGASLHAKVLVVDGSAALIGSANVTGAALERNLECGLLVRGGPEPAAVRGHVRSLVELGVLLRLT